MDTYAVKFWKPGGEIDRSPDLILQGFVSQELACIAGVSLTRSFWGENIVIQDVFSDEIWVDLGDEDSTTIAATIWKDSELGANEPTTQPGNSNPESF